MNQLEQLREQCAKTCEIMIDRSNTDIGKAMAECCAEKIRVMPLPDMPDYEKQITELKTEIAKLRGELTVGAYLRKENEKLKESLRFVIEQVEGWQIFATGCEQDDVEEMKLARERAK